MKIISVVGPTQSGSTLLFNLLRFMYEEQGKKVNSCWVRDFRTGNYDPAEILVVKCHKYNQLLKEKSDETFLPIRDIRDTAISSCKRKGFKGQKIPKISVKWRFSKFVKYMYKNINLFNSWKEDATYIFKYERYKANPEKELQRIGKHLGISLTEQSLQRILQRSEELHESKKIVKKDNFDDPRYRKTLMTQSHNSSGGKVNKFKKFYTKGQQRKILRDQNIYEFLKTHGYEVDKIH